MKVIKLYVDGMVCNSCENIIENVLLEVDGVIKVNVVFKNSNVEITYDENKVNEKTLKKTIKNEGYEVIEKPNDSKKSTFGLLILIFSIFYIVKNTVGFNYIPEVNEEMGYGLIFIVGLLTSIHCIAMCGGIALSQSVNSNSNNKVRSSILYNIGRVISYTLIGGIVGGLGQIITPSGQFKGIVAVFAGIFMILLGLKMLNIIYIPRFFKFKVVMPKFITNNINKNNTLTPFFIGIANGFMPCGPLQTMQLYALGTGSFVKGALSMFLFSSGTVPLMLGFGAITSIIDSRSNKRILKISSILVIVLGIIMANRGLALSGLALDMPGFENSKKDMQLAKIENGKQVVNLTVKSSQYIPDSKVVKVGEPVKINLDIESLNGCNNPIVISKYGIEKDLTKDNSIEFIPDTEGPITISCWMGMITTKLYAVNDLSDVNNNEFDSKENYNEGFSGSGLCSVQSENKAVIADIKDNNQVIEMNVNSSGYSPNILVVQKDIPVTWVINGEEVTYCNNSIIIKGTDSKIEVKEGKSGLKFTPNETGEIEFTCWMGMLGGKIVVVDDINNVDLKSLEETANQNIQNGGGCCGN
ncbi:urease accessory protein UreH domain-containing protein [Tepidibacter aestuarii]|uniref:urease accessory protein UreH domain-containing protein n=1 Tax=Tepidibacter aestuarii TaxID=2925782 RepID=UPI0020BF043E|nr:sulfite exporter TauE/SafE family protein [Tepidibacter aestuarii]CAH2212218.1 copper insertion chaperone and transporter component [Tepidibacter aestuarii]